MELKNISNRLADLAEEQRQTPDMNTDVLDGIVNELDAIIEADKAWSHDTRPAPQVHFRVNVSGLKRVPDATFTMEGDIRDLNPTEFWANRDAFQREVDLRYPLEKLEHFVELPPPG